MECSLNFLDNRGTRQGQGRVLVVLVYAKTSHLFHRHFLVIPVHLLPRIKTPMSAFKASNSTGFAVQRWQHVAWGSCQQISPCSVIKVQLASMMVRSTLGKHGISFNGSIPHL